MHPITRRIVPMPVNLPAARFVLLPLFVACALARADTIELANGDRLTGDIVDQDEDFLTLDHPILGRLTLARDAIVAVQATADPPPTPAVAAVAATPTVVAAPVGGWFSGWERALEIGVAGSNGKSDDLKINAAINGDYADEQRRWRLRGAYYRNEADGALSDHSLYTELQHDWLEPGSPWFGFASGRFDWDEFKDWDYRLSADGGVGYEFIRSDSATLRGRVGLGAQQTFGGVREEFVPEGLLGVAWSWQITPLQALTFDNTLHPSLKYGGEYRNLADAAWQIDLDQAMGLALKFGVSHEYDSAAIDQERHDLKYTGALVWQL
jgi:putative salt-induced outer membrane protein YdiY